MRNALTRGATIGLCVSYVGVVMSSTLVGFLVGYLACLRRSDELRMTISRLLPCMYENHSDEKIKLA